MSSLVAFLRFPRVPPFIANIVSNTRIDIHEFSVQYYGFELIKKILICSKFHNQYSSQKFKIKIINELYTN